MLIAIGAGLVAAYGCIFALMRSAGRADAASEQWTVEYRKRAS